MSDAITTDESELFELLPGLPGVGPYPEQFTATGHGTHSEGVVVRFHPRSSQAWVGNFQPGIYGYDGALLHPDGHTVIVVSGGQAYHIDPESRRLLRQFGGAIADVVQDRARGLLVFSDGIRLWAMDVGGERWQTERISWDGIRDLAIDGEVVIGEAYDPMCDRWSSFSVSLETGTVRGGTYRL
jgi:hypothetical protein